MRSKALRQITRVRESIEPPPETLSRQLPCRMYSRYMYVLVRTVYMPCVPTYYVLVAVCTAGSVARNRPLIQTDETSRA